MINKPGQLPDIYESSGQAIIEAALTMLAFFMFLFAVFEAGRLLQVQQALTDAAREGARRSVAPFMHGGSQPDPATDVIPLMQSYLNAASIHIAATGCPAPTPGICVEPHYAIGSTLYTKVTVKYDYHPMTLSVFGLLNITLTGQSLMREENSPGS